ncbi:MAG TPA: ABC transporter ATP-binding protein [Planctomycetaceae bacterium]|nr:ABC transporter ATP-binding protein [Planctomycetaceae bacterium]
MIRVENLSLRAGHFALDSISFEIPSGRYGVLMGRTGVGKTTLLESLCGLRQVTAGRIWLGDREVTNLKPAERGIGFVPQDAALFDTMSVREHLGFALAIRKAKRPAIEARVAELAELLGIEKLLERKPHGLSGGERQRVALGRALSAHPTILCMDEPLSALDEATRDEMYALLESVRSKAGVTTLHITHNRAEAVRLADVVLLLENGTIRSLSRDELQNGNGVAQQRAPRESSLLSPRGRGAGGEGVRD